MRKKRLVAAVTALSLAAVPTPTLADDRALEDKPPNAAVDANTIISDDGLASDAEANPSDTAETPASPDANVSEGAGAEDVTRDDREAEDADLGDEAGDDLAASVEQGEEEPGASGQPISHDDASEEAEPEAQEVNGPALSGTVFASALDGSTDYVLVNPTRIELNGENLTLKSLAGTHDGVAHSLVISGSGSITIPHDVSLHSLGVHGGAQVSIGAMSGFRIDVVGSGSTLAMGYADVDEISVREAGASLAAGAIRSGQVEAAGQVSVVTGDASVFRIDASEGATVGMGAISTQWVNVNSGASLTSNGPLAGSYLNVDGGSAYVVGRLTMNSHVSVGGGAVTSTGPVSADGHIEVRAGGVLTAHGRGDAAVVAGTQITGSVVTPERGYIDASGGSPVVVAENGEVVTDVAVLRAPGDVEEAPAYELYPLTGDTWTKGTDQGMLFGSNGDRDDVTGVYLDGERLEDGFGVFGVGDVMVVGLTSRALEGLDVGGHTLTVDFGGQTASAPFTVRAGEDGGDQPGDGEDGGDQPGDGEAGFSIISGGGTWVRGSDDELKFDTDADIDPDGVTVDGSPLVDGTDYLVIYGSDGMTVALLPSYLDGLPLGEHEIAISFGDANTPTATFVVLQDDDVVHRITSGQGGAWTSGDEAGLPFGTNALDDPLVVAVNGVPLTAGVDYTLTSAMARVGERTITLAPDLLGGLGLGTHTLTVVFADGDIDETAFAVEPRDYVITSGDGGTWEQESDNHLAFVTDGHEDDLVGVTVNGELLVASVDYLVDDGGDTDGNGDSGDNVGVTLTDEFLSTLGVDEHDITVQFDDGGAEGSFFVTAADDGAGTGGGTAGGTGGGSGTVRPPAPASSGLTTSTGGGVLPKTGDPALAAGSIVGAGALLAAIGAALRRRGRLDDEE